MSIARISGQSKQENAVTNTDNIDPENFNGKIESLTRLADAWANIPPNGLEAVLRTMIQQSQDAVLLIDPEFRILESNPRAREVFRIPPEAAELRLNNHVTADTVKDCSGNCCSWEDSVPFRCIQGEMLEEVERLVVTDGATHYYSVSGYPIRGTDDRVEMALVVARETTEMKDLQFRAEELMAEASQQQTSLHRLLNHVPFGVLLLDSEMKLLAANRAYRDYFDTLAPFATGARLDHVLPLAKESGITTLLRRALEGGRPIRVQNFRYEGFSKGVTYWNGSAVPMRLHLEEGPADAIAMVALDVTDEIHAREQLVTLAALAERRASEIETQRARLNAIIEAVPVALIVCDKEGNVTAFNSAARKLGEKIDVKSWLTEQYTIRTEPPTNVTTDDGSPLTLDHYPIVRSLNGEICTDVIVRCPAASQPGTRTLSINSAPLRDSEGRITGTVAAVTDLTQQRRTQEQIEENYQREHAIATKLQESFLAQDLPEIEGFGFEHAYRPAKDAAMVGGDFFDVFKVGEGRYAIVIADVAGKGLKSAVYTAMTKYILRAYALEECDPRRVLARLSDALTACTPAEVFVTLVYGIIDTISKTFTYGNAGHEQPILYRADVRMAAPLDVTGRALALVSGSAYTAHTINLNSGDAIVLYTDGITDAGWGINRLGQERLVDMVRSGANGALGELVSSIMGVAQEFAGGMLADDAALLAIRAGN